jgi:hypothetical protein
MKTTQELVAEKQAQPLVTLRVDAGSGGVVAVVRSRPVIKELAAEWMYILRNRSRWSGDEDLRADLRARAAETLDKLGVGERELRSIVAARTRHVEVEFHDPEEKPPARSTTAGRPTRQDQEQAERRQLLDAATVFPWEFLLSTATREYGRSHALIITRLLARTIPQVAKQRKLKRLLFVESAPGRIEDCYSFDSERTRLRAALGVDWRISPSERIDRLTARIQKFKPEVIHVSGVDNHQVVQPELIPGFYDEPEIEKLVPDAPRDGMIVQGTDLAEVPCPHDELAAALVPKANRRTAPLLVTLNLYYSAARIGRDVIRRGAHAALGFLDEIDDELAEYFFQAFFLAWRRGQSVDDLPRAFGQTWELLRDRGQHLFGTSIVLWLAKSAFAGNRQAAMRTDEEEDLVVSAEDQLPTEDERKATRLEPITSVLQVDLDVPSEVNYSLLHNARRFLDKLTLSKLVEHALDEVSVMVDLNVGDTSLPFRHTETLLTEPQKVLADDVCLPLTAPLLRSLRERIQSTLYVKVEWDHRVAFEQTKSVTLLPVDEWFDDTQKNPWLPSFVLPRDPAIARIISAARRYLVTLQDDPTAGFDGYQSVDDSLDDPSEAIDRQVQAIWTALVHEYRLLYINPPPAYSSRNQRLRTPSEIIASNSGTCVDLALLLAACLEYIDIHPVIVLLTGHAFVGYWRSDDFHTEFRSVSHVPKSMGLEVGPLAVRSTISLVDTYGWRVAQQQYGELQGYLRDDKLRCLEATGLCFNYSFTEALEEGLGNMRAPDDFDSLIDVRLARLARPPVTPLPVIQMLGRATEGGNHVAG